MRILGTVTGGEFGVGDVPMMEAWLGEGSVDFGLEESLG